MKISELTFKYREALFGLLDGEDSGDLSAAPAARSGMLAVTRELRRLGLSFMEAKAATHTMMIQHHNTRLQSNQEKWTDE